MESNFELYCERCKYSKQMIPDPRAVTELIEAHRGEPENIDNLMNMGLMMEDHYNSVMCHRYPRTVKKDKRDWCGEFLLRSSF